MQRWNARAGFTLTELLVALMILALISMAATSSLSVGKKIWQRAQLLPDMTLAEAEKNQLRSTIFRRTNWSESRDDGISGTKEGIVFTGRLPMRSGYDVVGVITVRTGTTGIAIQFGQGNPVKTVLLRHLKGAVLSFYGRKPGEKIDFWHDDWSLTDPPPKLIRFNFQTQDEFGFEELVVSIR